MFRPAAFVAGCLTAFLIAGPAFAAMPDMNAPPAMWNDTGAKPFVQRDAANHIAAIGLVIPGTLVRTPPEPRSEAVYPMAGAGLVQTANLQWHPGGHEPEHVYDIPHFDVHFYTISERVRQGIVPGAAAGRVMPPKAILPPNGLLAPGFVPGMGMHDVSKTQPEFTGGRFTVSPIIGYWNGDLAFFEVMFTKAWLTKNAARSGAYPQPTSVRTHGLYPTRYDVHYDKANDAYRVSLTGFRQR